MEWALLGSFSKSHEFSLSNLHSCVSSLGAPDEADGPDEERVHCATSPWHLRIKYAVHLCKNLPSALRGSPWRPLFREAVLQQFMFVSRIRRITTSKGNKTQRETNSFPFATLFFWRPSLITRLTLDSVCSWGSLNLWSSFLRLLTAWIAGPCCCTQLQRPH